METQWHCEKSHTYCIFIFYDCRSKYFAEDKKASMLVGISVTFVQLL